MMKTKVTITLDPLVVKRAKVTAKSRNTNLSAMIEELLRGTTKDSNAKRPAFTKKWAGKLSIRANEKDELLNSLKNKFDLGES